LETLFKASTTPQNEALKTETVSSKSSQVLILRTCKTRSTALDSSKDQHRNASKRRYRRGILKNRIKPHLSAAFDIARQRRAVEIYGGFRGFSSRLPKYEVHFRTALCASGMLFFGLAHLKTAKSLMIWGVFRASAKHLF
jgi:hypothetical protein